MRHLLAIFLVFLSLDISYQLDCSSFGNDLTCGNHNTGYKLQCQKFTNCEEVEVDDGCELDSSHNCKKKDSLPEGEDCINFGDSNKCKRVQIDDHCEIVSSKDCQVNSQYQTSEYCTFSWDKKRCQQFTKTCTDYSDSTCGNLAKIYDAEKKQCIQLPTGNKCSEISIDQYCAINETSKKCEERGEKRAGYICDMNYSTNECKSRIKVCSDQDINDCQGFNGDCYKIINDDKCREVKVDSKCKIESGDCIDGTGIDSAYQKCGFNEDKTKCEVKTKYCIDITDVTKCNYGILTSSDRICSKVKMRNNKESCEEIKINSLCEMNNGECKLKETNEKQTCVFSEINFICYLYEQGTGCNIIQTNCNYDETHADPTKICKYEVNDDGTKFFCKAFNKECEDYTTQEACERDTIISQQNIKKCSWNANKVPNCQEYEIDDICTVNNGVCEKQSDAKLGVNEDCIFDILETKCKHKNKECGNYYNDCSSKFEITETSQCVQLDASKYCKSFVVDKDCKVVAKNDQLECVHRDDSFDQTKGYCDFTNADKTACKIRPRKCTEYTNNSCNNKEDLPNCGYYSNINNCIETDDFCIVSGSNCIEKEGNNPTLTEKEKCAFVTDEDSKITGCKKRNKLCDEYTKADECSNIPRTSDYQCFKFSGENNCRNIRLVGNCFVDNEGNCVASGNLGSNDICAFDDNSKQICQQREKLCSDIKDNSCNNYSPLTKLCFNIDSQGCKEIKVDGQCKINENNECTGNNCYFDNDKDKCYYKNDEGSFLRLRQFLLFALFFIL